MKHKVLTKLLGVCALLCAATVPQAAFGQQWSSGYWTGANGVPQSSIQWNALTHIVHVNTEANGDGSLTYQCSTGPGCSEGAMGTEATTLISAAHSHGAKVLDYVGTGSGTSWTGATNSSNLSTFVNNIMQVVNAYGYDGVVIDWEGPAYNFTQMGNLFSSLKARLGSKPLVTTVISTYSADSSFAALRANIDRYDIMSFDKGGANPTWFNEPLFNDPPGYPSDGDGGTSMDFDVQLLISDGVPASKINCSLPFYGEIQSGATGPRQNASVSSQQINYNRVLANYPSQSSNPNRDSVAQVPWFASGSSWVNYDDAASIVAKVNYAKSKNLGGWFIWALDQDYFPTQSPSHPLLAAVAAAMGGSTSSPTAPAISNTSPLPAGAVGNAYSQTLSAAGSTPITWGIISGTLPAGLALGTGGIISGTPSSSGTSTFTVQATNSAGNNSKQLSISINGTGPTINSFTATPSSVAPGGSVTLAWSITGATTTSIDQAIGPVTGSSTTVHPTSTTTYKLTASNANGSSTATATVTVHIPCAPGTPQATAMPAAAPTDTNLFRATDQAITSLSAAINSTTLTIPVAGNAGSTPSTGTVASEIGLLFMNPNGFAESDASAVVFPAKSPSTGASATAQKIMHGRFDIFMPADDSTWAWFPYSSFNSYAAAQASAGHPLWVTATYGGTHRPVYFAPSLALDGSNRPTTPSSNWRRLVKTDDPNFVSWWVNNYVRPIVYQNTSGQSNLWTGLDECYFLWGSFGVIDDSGVFQTVSNYDSPFPQNEAQLLTMLGGFFTQLKSIAPDVKVMPNLASGLSDLMLTNASNFAALYKDAPAVMVENIYTPSATDSFSRGTFFSNITNIYNFGASGKAGLMRANIASATDATGSRTALIVYLLMRGTNNWFYAPNLGLNPSTNITAENPTSYKPMWDALGEPGGALTSTQIGGSTGDRLYSRTTSNGVIYLNWTGSTQTVTLPTGSWVDRNGNPVTTLSIPDVTGDYALLRNPSGGTTGGTSPFSQFQIADIGGEQVKLCAVSGTSLTVCSGGRGFAGTTAATHNQGALVRGAIVAVYHNQAAAELIAGQTWISTSAHPGSYPGSSLTGASWPGHIATIDELFWMTDHAQELLTAALSPSASSGTVSSGPCYHASQLVLSDNEIFKIGSVSGNTLGGLTRGLAGTTPASHAQGASVFGGIFTEDVNRMFTELAATEQDLFGRAGSTQSSICGTGCAAVAGQSWPNHVFAPSESCVATPGGSFAAACWNRFAAEQKAFFGDLKAHP